MNKLVSIIIPCYNQKEYLEECVEHAVSQTYEEVEILLIDDGSSDGTGQLCDQYVEQYENITVIHKENGGLSSARNCGLEHAKGQWILFCDCDDFLHTEAVKELVELVSGLQRCDFILFDAIAFRDVLSKETISSDYIRKIAYNGTCDGMEVLGELLDREEFSPSVCLHMYNRDFLNRCHIRFYNGIIHEDALFSFYAYVNARYVARSTKCYYFRRIHEGSITTEAISVKRFDGLSICCKEIGNYLQKNNLTKAQRHIGWSYFSLMFENLCAVYKKLLQSNVDITERYFEELANVRKKRYYGCISLKSIWRFSRAKVYWQRLKGMVQDMKKRRIYDDGY